VFPEAHRDPAERLVMAAPGADPADPRRFLSRAPDNDDGLDEAVPPAQLDEVRPDLEPAPGTREPPGGLLHIGSAPLTKLHRRTPVFQ